MIEKRIFGASQAVGFDASERISTLARFKNGMTPKSAQRPRGSITYRFATPYDPKANILYVNVIPKFACTNARRFCSRNAAIEGKRNIYETKAGTNLYLPKAPSIEELVREIEANRHPGTSEIAFVGLGEPLLQFKRVRDAIRQIRKKGFTENIRIDTNGLVKCRHPSASARSLKRAGLNEIRISVNAISPEEYQTLCRSRYGSDAFRKLCEFVRECVREGIKTKASFVIGFSDQIIQSRRLEEYRKFAQTLGIHPKDVILRDYVRPA